MQNKTCTKCGVEHPATREYFGPDKKCKDGLSSWCRKCKYAGTADWNKNNIEYRKKYRKKLIEKNPNHYRKKTLKKYNLSIEDYDKMSEKQNGLCAICGLSEVVKYRDRIRKFAIDHNHNTGQIRGLLCSKCNRAIGLLKVDSFGILNLEKAIEYVRKYAHL